MQNSSKLLTGIILLVTISGCSSIESEATEQVARDLFDPSSAQFRDVSEVADNLVCGEVNGKNRMGAYVGFTKFAAYKANGS